jgi:hypothetical protein
LKQFNIKLKAPNAESPSWLEQWWVIAITSQNLTHFNHILHLWKLHLIIILFIYCRWSSGCGLLTSFNSSLRSKQCYQHILNIETLWQMLQWEYCEIINIII